LRFKNLLYSDAKFSDEAVCQFEGVVLAAIMGVNLKHVGYPQAFERGM